MERALYNRVVCILAILVLAAGCSRESRTTVSGGAGAPLPTVNYAEIMSNGFLSERPLNVQFNTKEGVTQIDMFRIKWYVDGNYIDSVTGNVLDPQYFRKGSRVEVEIVPADGQRLGSPFRSKAVIIKNTPPVMTSANLQPVPAYAGDTITAVPVSNDRDGDTVQYSYQWLVNNSPVEGGANGTLPTTGLKVKDTIAVTITPNDGEEKGQPMTTGSLALSGRAPEITSVPPSGLQDGVYIYQVVAKDPEGGPLSYSIVSGPPGMSIDGNGLIRWQPPTGMTGRQEITTKISVKDDEGSEAFQEFSLNIELR